MMLAKESTPRHANRITQVILVTNTRRTLQWPAQSMTEIRASTRWIY